MNHDCHGDIFERWGKRYGRCLADGSFFDYRQGIEFCPECHRPWLGKACHDKGIDSSDIPSFCTAQIEIGIDLPHFKMLAEERLKKIIYLEEVLEQWKDMYYKASNLERVK